MTAEPHANFCVGFFYPKSGTIRIMDPATHKYANLLTVFAQPVPETDNQFTVLWRSGLNKQGKVNVTIAADVADKKAIAELTAMQHIIEVQEVIGSDPPIKGLKLVFSVPAIRKVYLNKSDKKHLYPYAYFLTTRFSAADVGIEQECDWIKPRADQNVSDLEVSEPLGEWVNIYGFGKVCITKHAIDQFSERCNHISPAEAFRSLSNLVNETQLERIPENPSKEERESKAIAKLFHRRTKWCFVIVNNSYGKPAIATAYPRL
jgi:hypothetical protein